MPPPPEAKVAPGPSRCRDMPAETSAVSRPIRAAARKWLERLGHGVAVALTGLGCLGAAYVVSVGPVLGYCGDPFAFPRAVTTFYGPLWAVIEPHPTAVYWFQSYAYLCGVRCEKPVREFRR